MAVRLSDLRASHAYLQENPGIHFCYRLNKPMGHSVAGMIR
jgi:hypothetical protein